MISFANSFFGGLCLPLVFTVLTAHCSLLGYRIWVRFDRGRAFTGNLSAHRSALCSWSVSLCALFVSALGLHESLCWGWRCLHPAKPYTIFPVRLANAGVNLDRPSQ